MVQYTHQYPSDAAKFNNIEYDQFDWENLNFDWISEEKEETEETLLDSTTSVPQTTTHIFSKSATLFIKLKKNESDVGGSLWQVSVRDISIVGSVSGVVVLLLVIIVLSVYNCLYKRHIHKKYRLENESSRGTTKSASSISRDPLIRTAAATSSLPQSRSMNDMIRPTNYFLEYECYCPPIDGDDVSSCLSFHEHSDRYDTPKSSDSEQVKSISNKSQGNEDNIPVCKTTEKETITDRKTFPVPRPSQSPDKSPVLDVRLTINGENNECIKRVSPEDSCISGLETQEDTSNKSQHCTTSHNPNQSSNNHNQSSTNHNGGSTNHNESSTNLNQSFINPTSSSTNLNQSFINPTSTSTNLNLSSILHNQSSTKLDHYLISCVKNNDYFSSSLALPTDGDPDDEGLMDDSFKTRSLPAWVRSKKRPLGVIEDLNTIYEREPTWSKRRRNRMRSDAAQIIAMTKSRGQLVSPGSACSQDSNISDIPDGTPSVQSTTTTDTCGLINNEAVIVYDERTAL